jgi:SAM-dependent methyltransferase
MQSAYDDKEESRRQWNNDPCGANTAGAAQPETAAWYTSVRETRYRDYAPWMPATLRYSDWRGAQVLEIGVGLGSDHLSFALAGAHLHALDLSAEHLRHTQRHLAYHGLKTEATLGDAEHNPYPDSHFDLVYSFGVLHHTPNIEAAIAEVHRVLKPGGTALISVYHRNSWFFWICTILVNGMLKLGLPRKGWRRLLADIEYRGAGNSAVPLVHVYSRRQVRDLFRAFSVVDVTAHGVDRRHFWFPGRLLLRSVNAATLERLLGRGGWYVVARARK